MTAGPISEMTDYFLGLLVTAGDYALAIQPQLDSGRGKDGHNAWVSALTDADLSVQNFMEVATLARYPGVHFSGEEHRQSLNQKYFPVAAEISVHLDPINGTFLYKNQRPNWDIIVSIAEHGRLAAAISYVPSSGRIYLALREAGARITQNSRKSFGRAVMFPRPMITPRSKVNSGDNKIYAYCLHSTRPRCRFPGDLHQISHRGGTIPR